MKYIFLIFFMLVIAFTAKAQSPWYFGTGEAINLTNGIAYNNGVKVIAGSLDPSATPVNAPSGSMYIASSGTTYLKQDAGSTTNWLPLGIATTGSLTTINGQSGPGITIASGSSGTDFNIASAANTITLNIPTASASNRGLLSSSDYSSFLAKQDAITGGASTIVSSNLTANRALISNGSGKVAVSATTDTELGYVSGVTSAIQTQIDGKEPSITSGTTSQYWRGDKTFQALDKAAVGLPNADNTSDANKPVSTATQTALDLKLDGASVSIDSEVVLYSGTTGKISKRATGTGYAKLTSGVLSTSSTVAASDLTGQVALVNGGTNKSITASAGAVAYSDSDSFELSGVGSSGQYLKSNGTAAPVFSAIDLATSSVTGVLPIANGGTSASSFTANYVLLGNGASSFQTVAPGTAGNMLVSTGSTWVSSGVSGTTLVAAPGVTSPKFCYYGFGGASATLAAPTNCTTGTCVEVYDTCGAITPPSFSSTGIYTNFTIANGTFAANTLTYCSCKAFDTSGVNRDCRLYQDTSDQTWTSNSNGGYVGNLYTTNPTTSGNTASNSYVQIKCEGQAP